MRGLSVYVKRLLEHGIKVIPVKGWGGTKEEAKAPLIPQGFRHTDYRRRGYVAKAERLSRKALALIEAGRITAYGLLGAVNGLILLDFDAGKFPCRKYGHVFRTLAREVFVEQTVSGGFHTVIRACSEGDLHLRFVSRLGEVDNKTFGYIIAHPSRLKWRGGEARYRKLEDARHVWETAKLSEVEALLADLLEIEASRGVISRGVPVRTKYPVYDLDLNPLSNRQLIALLYLVAMEIGCRGLAELYKRWFEDGVIPLRNYVYVNSRGVHFTFEVTTLGLLKTLGLTYGRALKFIGEFKYIDGIGETFPENSSLKNVYVRDERNLVVRGLCPFCHPPCTLTPLHRLLSYNVRDFRLLRKIVDELR